MDNNISNQPENNVQEENNVQTDVSASVTEVNNAVDSVSSSSAAVTNPVESSTGNSNPNQGVSTPPTLPEEKGKKSSLIYVLVAVIGVVLLLGLFLIPRLFVSGKTVINKEVDAVFSGVKKVFKESQNSILNYDLDKDSLGIDGSFKIDSNYNQDGMDLSKLKNYQFDYAGVIDKSNNEASLKLALGKNSKDIVAAKGYINGKKVLVSLGDLFNKGITTELEKEIKELDLSKTDNTKDIEKLLDKTEKIVKKNINEKDITKTKEEKEINGKKGKYTKVEYKINVQEFSKNIMKAYQEDSEIISILARLSSMKESDIKDSLKDSISDLDDSSDNSIMTVDVYLEGLANQVKEIEIKSEEDSIVIDKVGDVYKYRAESDGQKLFTGEYDKSKKSLTLKSDAGQLTVTEENDTCHIDFKYKDSYQSVKINVTIKNKVEKNSQSNDTTVSFVYDMDGEKIEATLSNKMNITKNQKVEKLTMNDTVDIDNMTDSEMEAISTAFMNKLSDVIQDIMPAMASDSSLDFRQLF